MAGFKNIDILFKLVLNFIINLNLFSCVKIIELKAKL